MKIAHLTTVDMSLRYLLMPQLEAASEIGESMGISAPGPYVEELEARGIRHLALSSSTRGVSLLSDLRAMSQLWRVLKRERVDVLHTHNPKPGVYGRILGRLVGVPIVVNTVHGLYATPQSSVVKRGLVYLLEAIASRFSDAELVQNPEDLDLLERLHIVPKTKLRYLGNGVDLRRFDPDRVAAKRDETRAGLGLDADDVVVGTVGRLVAEKGLPELIEAVGLLGSEVRVVVAGPHDPEKGDALGPDFFEKAARIGVSFVGMRRDVDALYGAFDIFALPSHREGFPRAAMEAAASGLPLVLTDIRGCRQVVESGVNGLLVPVGDVEALARSLDTLVWSPELRRRMGDASAERAREHFDERRVVETVMSTYRELARTKGMSWLMDTVPEDVTLRVARRDDALAVARLHAGLIDRGFLSSLGTGFLRVLYESLIDGHGVVVVADSDGDVLGFIAGTDDTGHFYRSFIRRRFFQAAWRLIPALMRPRTWRLVWETLRHGSTEGPSAELLAMAVAPRAQGRGLGSRLVHDLLSRTAERGEREMRVIVGADNHAAISLYTRCGFGESRQFEFHRGTASLEMTWRSQAS